MPIGALGAVKTPNPPAPYDWMRAYSMALGYTTQTMPYFATTNTSLLATQLVYAAPALVYEGDSLANVYAAATVAAGSLTVATGAVFGLSGAQLAVSANQSGSVNGATGRLAFPMATPWVAPRDMWVYLAVLFVGTTPPTVLRASGNNHATTPPTGGQSFAFCTQSGQTDMPTTFVPASASSVAIWLAAN
ncbi:MAG: hypothetical protein LC118_07960 [Dehalococcoidia bacterium]|nr:hypothetical protein [Dehalococcoidia bacterium]